MQPDSQQRPVAVGFDSSFDRGIDQVLALGMYMGLGVKNKARLFSCTVSRNDLSSAVFCDLMGSFYFPNRNVERDDASGQNLIGLTSAGRVVTNPLLAQVVDKRTAEGRLIYPRVVTKLSDTADPAVLLRNQMYLDRERLVMSGPPVNLLAMVALPGAAALIPKRVEFLVVAAGRFARGKPQSLVAEHAAQFRELLAKWPAPIVFVGAEVGEAIPYPASSIERDYAWAPNHPVRDAYCAYGKMPYDATTQAMAAVLYSVQPADGYFQVSEPGTVTILDDGVTTFAASPKGNHRHVIVDSAQTKRVQDFYTQTTSVDPRSRPDAKPKAMLDGNAPQRGIGRPMLLSCLALLACLAFLSLPKQASGQDAGKFDQIVKPALDRCVQCHNARLRTSGLDVTGLSSLDALLASRDVWERMVRRVRAGEMPPSGAPRTPAPELTGMADFVENYWRRADSSRAPDPGRDALHRLNRTEYANSVRDLLGLRFRPENDLPADDSGGGFDTIGDLLTMSPALVDRYVTVSEMLARWAVSDEVPPEPLVYFGDTDDPGFAYVDGASVELRHRVDYSGDYVIRVGLIGARPNDAPPVKLGFWVDGALVHTEMLETKGYDAANKYPESETAFRAFVPAGDHVFRASYIDDTYLKSKDRVVVFAAQNKFIQTLMFAGPFRSTVESESRRRILFCRPDGDPACVRRIIEALARRAFRRPVGESEIQSLMRFPELLRASGKSPAEGVQMAIQAILVSPSFLYRVEQEANPGESANVQRISEFDLASRLSYFLWSSMPDDQLLDLAGTGRLSKPDVLRKQVDRMLSDPKAAAFAENFAGQWLETRSLNSVSPDREKFPNWSIALRDAMKSESALFFEYVLRENRPITDFLDSDYTFLNQILAEHYGIPGVTGEQFRRVDLRGLAARDQRGGVLTQAGVLTVSSYANRTSPVLRGKYVLHSILGTPPLPPPPNVPRLDEAAVGVEKSMREQLEQHRKSPACAACHTRMDPLGFGLENYDAIGQWRTQDGKFPVDSSGRLPDGNTFQSPSEMRKALTAQLPQISRNLTEKLLTYALRRSIEPYDRPTVDKIQQDLAAGQYRFRTLVYSTVESLPFQYKRIEAARRSQ